jgi:hypothetical protein
MHKLTAPTPPAGFALKVNAAVTALQAGVVSGTTLVFPDLWKNYKETFIEAQHGKCGFCEGPVWGLQYGDVEHFRPKAAVSELNPLNPATWGAELPWSSRVKGRKPILFSTQGYWWECYRWENYLLACQVCNQQWKKNLFPVAAHNRLNPPAAANAEHELLLNAFYDHEHPGRHLAYGRLGEIMPFNNSPYGKATIQTCGLDRPSLRQARFKLASTTHERIDELANDITERELLWILKAVSLDGEEKQWYCGMVRAIFEQRTGQVWAGLQEMIDKLERKPDLSTRLCDC